MSKNKAQSNIIAAILLIGISLFLVIGTYYWLVPTVKEMTSLNDVKEMEKQMLDIHRAISQASREQSQRSLPINIKQGTIRVRERSILYRGYHTLPGSEKGHESILYGGINETRSSGLGYINCSEKVIGKLGENEPVCLLRRGSAEIELRYLRLNNTLTGNLHEIKFKLTQKSHGSKGNTQILVQWLNKTERTRPSGNKNITTYMIVEIY